MNGYGSDSPYIVVPLDSPIAEWTRWCERKRAAPLAGLHVGERPPTAFVPDHIIVDAGQPAVVAEIVDRYGAEVVPAAPLPTPRTGRGPKAGVDLDAAPLPVLLRLATAPSPSARAAEIVADALGEPVSLSSEQGAALFGLVAELAADGLPVGLDFVGRTAALPLATVPDFSPSAPTESLAIEAYAGRARVAAAWQLVEAYRRLRTTPQVKVAILDGGFWLDGRTPVVAQGQTGSGSAPSSPRSTCSTKTSAPAAPARSRGPKGSRTIGMGTPSRALQRRGPATSGRPPGSAGRSPSRSC